MSDTKSQNDASWVSLKEHIDSLLKEMDLRYQQRYDAQIKALDAALLAAEKAVQTALSAAEKAVNKAEIASGKQFESVNEFRKAYQDLLALTFPRVEAEQRLIAVMKEIDELKKSSQLVSGRSTGLREGWGLLVSVVVVVSTIVGVVVAFLVK